MKDLKKANISKNFASYYEEYTIDYANYDNIMNSPFYSFTKIAKEGLAGFFYLA